MPIIDLPWCEVCADRDKCEDGEINIRRNCSKRYIYDTLSGLVYTGAVWSPDIADAKMFWSEQMARMAIAKLEAKQKQVVADLSKQFGG